MKSTHVRKISFTWFFPKNPGMLTKIIYRRISNVIIECKETEAEMVKDLLWANYALGVRKFSLDNNESFVTNNQ